MTYEATYNVNGTHPMRPYTYTNKETAIKEIRVMAEGEINGKQNCSWEVRDAETYKLVAQGGRVYGARVRYK